MKKVLFTGLIIFALFAGCVYVGQQAPSGNAATPVILSFEATPANILTGGAATLMWDVQGANIVSIDQGIGSVALKGSRTVSPSSTVTFTLTASNSYGSVTASTQVVVAGSTSLPVVQTPAFNLPLVTVFAAQPANIIPGWACALKWEVQNASEVSIEPGIGPVQVIGSKSVNPNFTTNYKLTATNSQGSILATTTLTVSSVPASRDTPVITSFTANPYVIKKGDSSILTWHTLNASSATMDRDIGIVSADGVRQVSPDATTTYTLLVTSPDGAQYQTVTVNVR